MQPNKVVVRYLDGRVLKGITRDFLPTKESFHLASAVDHSRIIEVFTRELKAVFFVRSFTGDPAHETTDVLDALARMPGRKLTVTFTDGEVMHGTTNAYTPGRSAFFLVPADPGGNNERAYVFTHATRSVELFVPAAANA